MNLFTKDNHFIAGFGSGHLARFEAGHHWNLSMGRVSSKPHTFLNEFNRALKEISKTFARPTYLITGRELDSLVVKSVLDHKLPFQFLSYTCPVGRIWKKYLPHIELVPLDWDEFLNSEFKVISDLTSQNCPLEALVLALALKAKDLDLNPIVHTAELDAQFRNFSWKIDFGEIRMSPLTWFKSQKIVGVPQLLHWSPELMASALNDSETLRLLSNSEPTCGSLLAHLAKKFAPTDIHLPESERVSTQFLVKIESLKANVKNNNRPIYELILDVNEVSDYLMKELNEQTH